MMKRIAILLAAIFTAVSVSARINVDVPGVVGLAEQFNVTFTLSEKPSGFSWTPGDNFQVVWGPQTGSSTSVTIINGKTQRSSQYTYTYVLLPKSVGVFSLPAARATVDGNEVLSATPKIEVVSNGSQSQTAKAAGEDRPSAAHRQQDTDTQTPDLFMRFSLSRTSAVVGEPITATLKLFTRGSIAGFEDAKFPTFNGFWAQEIEAPQNIEFQRESVGDKIFNTAVLRKWLLIPQKSGSISIEPAELVCLVQQRVSGGGNSIFDGFFDDYQTFRKRVISSAYTVKVNPLPSNAPASFTGAVGEYAINAKLSKDSLKMHDAASLVITVNGKGNIALIGAPKVDFPPDSEVYDVKTTERIDKGNGGMSGSRTFEYPFIPRSHGTFVIEPIAFTYYDILSRRYVTLRTPPIEYNVAKSEGTDYVPSGGVAVSAPSRRDVKNLSEDVHYIRTTMPKMTSGRIFFVGSAMFWIVLLLILGLSVAAYFLISKFLREHSDIVLVRTKEASRVARKRLAVAEANMSEGKMAEFYEELHKALLGYVSDKFNIGIADLSKDVIATTLSEKGAPGSIVAGFTALLDACEFARYSPDSGSETMQESYDSAVEILSSLEENMKRLVPDAAKAVITVLLLLPGTLLGATGKVEADSLWDAGVAAYAKTDYVAAIEAFTAIEDAGMSSPELCTNIGNAFFKQKELPAAILYYERALKVDPSDKDAKYNLSVARQLTQDRIDSVPEFFLRGWLRKLCYGIPSNVWVALFFVLLSISCIMAVVFLLSRSPRWRRAGFYTAVAALLLSIPCLVNSAWQKHDFNKRDTAIVFAPVCSAKSAPAGTTDLFVIHEGTKVKVLEEVGDWTNIALSDGREGWIRTKDINLI